MPQLVKNLVDAPQQLRKHHHAARQFLQGRVAVVGGAAVIVIPLAIPLDLSFALCVIVIVSFGLSQKAHDGDDGLQRAAQVKQLVFLQVRVLQSDAGDGLSHVEEILQWKVVFLLLYAPHLPRLLEPRTDGGGVGAEGQSVHLLLAQRREAARLQQFAYLVKANLAFKVGWVNHAAKIIIYEQTAIFISG